RAVLLLQALEQREPILDLLQPFRRRLDRRTVLPEKRRELLELGFNAVAFAEKRLEPPIERGEVRHATPDATQTGQHGAVALIERGITLFAETLHALGAGQHLTRRRKIDVFGRVFRLEPGAIELRQL